MVRTFEIKLRNLTLAKTLNSSISCYKCGIDLVIGDKCVSRLAGNGGNNVKWYHEECARLVNII